MTSHRGVLPVLGAVVSARLLPWDRLRPRSLCRPTRPRRSACRPGVTASVSGSGAVSTKPFNDFPSAGGRLLRAVAPARTGSAFPASPDPDAQLSTDRVTTASRTRDPHPDRRRHDQRRLPLRRLRPGDRGAGPHLHLLGRHNRAMPEHPAGRHPDRVRDERRLGLLLPGDAARGAQALHRQCRRLLAPPRRPAGPDPRDGGGALAGRGDRAQQRDDPGHRPSAARAPGGSDEVIDITVADFANGDLDSVALLDDVRLGSTCARAPASSRTRSTRAASSPASAESATRSSTTRSPPPTRSSATTARQRLALPFGASRSSCASGGTGPSRATRSWVT